MGEEQVTKALLRWLLDAGWEIVSFDFPQSGTGRMLHPNDRASEKNRDAIVPDIIAVREERCVFFEDKDRFYLPDYEKQHRLIVTDDYSQAIEELLRGRPVRDIYYGIGLPTAKHGRRSREAAWMVDFIVGVNGDGSAQTLYSPRGDIF